MFDLSQLPDSLREMLRSWDDQVEVVRAQQTAELSEIAEQFPEIPVGRIVFSPSRSFEDEVPDPWVRAIGWLMQWSVSNPIPRSAESIAATIVVTAWLESHESWSKRQDGLAPMFDSDEPVTWRAFVSAAKIEELPAGVRPDDSLLWEAPLNAWLQEELLMFDPD